MNEVKSDSMSDQFTQREAPTATRQVTQGSVRNIKMLKTFILSNI